MTFEEAKKRIELAAKESRREYDLYKDEQSKGEEFGFIIALSILKHVDIEPAPKDKLTLTELANEQRKIFKFKYLTAEIAVYNHYFCLWTEKPFWNGKYWGIKENGKKHIVTDFLDFETIKSIDLSEYEDADGIIDYSKCIVEV